MADEVKLQKVTIAKGKTHTHQGKQYAEGDVIEVWPDQALWLQELGVIETGKKKAGGD